ncbi:cobalt-precorrin-5B (C(1))-methyltransferase [Methylocystis sp. MJC1]|jgi:cobalt-precorrin-5B (C1)-methyltransferase|uniref:cobalt-precorrin-5B (C(1))-methyltransferase n=1 Tax=Methylocystis sp. MJC1 TaxID=2654282 RepID=UPI0013EBC9D0|nr:cobalt-precorrin-5B (C(1))-methyltransferase [Methylocystis sp. MJC1]KAF2990420.1 Cobalt-precorrin-5B C(1)-methyltransferase [Methylocystis sp. MJC1]MBU6528215.1 cobalt-precorrin-5B (C(1))-methyltransferase [Methylocystis sp. MJC1]UZX11124.1 cobalt-precorrin-5B (C(1))-methyltransferase [Methylocystis sp. MJC1]
MTDAPKDRPLRRGWTTGACATAAARAAFQALVTGAPPPDPVEIALPSGKRVAFALAEFTRGDDFARAGVVKDAGDDPDVTHGALIRAMVRRAAPGAGVSFKEGEGVGVITRPGLPLPPGEPAINPVPRRMMRQTIEEAALLLGVGADAEIEISIPGGAEMAKHTLNGRLGIIGGLSILGTTGIVTPFSCAAWIDSIHRGVDVARASGLTHIAGTTGSTSEAAVKKLYDLPDAALIEMGDFVGGFLKYLRAHPVARVTIGGGFAKMTKLAQGRLDLHSGRSSVDFARLAQRAREVGATDEIARKIEEANSALEVLQIAQHAHVDLAAAIARLAYATAAQTLGNSETEVEVIVFDREGGPLARTGFRRVENV